MMVYLVIEHEIEYGSCVIGVFHTMALAHEERTRLSRQNGVAGFRYTVECHEVQGMTDAESKISD